MDATDSSTQSGSKTPRSFLKCKRCRDQRRKCDPEDRDWERQRQKCVVCIAGGHPCGPNVSHPSRQHRTSSAANSLPHSLQTSPLPLSTPPNTAPNSSQQSSQYYGATSSWSPTSGTSGAYSPLAESPLQDRGKSKIGSSSTPQIGRDAGLPDPVEAIRNRLNRQGTLSDLFAYLHSRSTSAIDAQPLGQAKEYQEIHQLVQVLKDNVRIEFTYLMKAIWEYLQRVPADEKELLLRRFRDELQEFVAIAGDERALGEDIAVPDDCQSVRKMQCRVNCQLAAICEADHYASAASRLRRGVISTRTRYGISDDGAAIIDDKTLYREMSHRITETFDSPDLDLPARYMRQYAKLLPQTGNLFSPFSLAHDAGRPLVSRDLLTSQTSEHPPCDLLQRAPLHIAAESGDVELMEAALSCPIDAKKQRDIFGMTALCVAAYKGHDEIFIKLAETEEDINAVEITGRNVLCIASEAGNLAIVRYLLEERGCRPNDLSGLGPAGKYSPLHAAAAGGHHDVAHLLTLHGASAIWEYQGLTAAQEAHNHGHHALYQDLHGLEEKEAAALPNQVERTKYAYFMDLAQKTPSAGGQALTPSPYTHVAFDQLAVTPIPSTLRSLMHSPALQEHTAMFSTIGPGPTPIFTFDDLTAGSMQSSLASLSSRQPSEPSSPPVNHRQGTKRTLPPSQESSPPVRRSQLAPGIPKKRQQTSNEHFSDPLPRHATE